MVQTITTRRTKRRGLWSWDSQHCQCCNTTLPSTAASPDLIRWRDSLGIIENFSGVNSCLNLILMFHLSTKWWSCFCHMFNRQMSGREWVTLGALNSWNDIQFSVPKISCSKHHQTNALSCRGSFAWILMVHIEYKTLKSMLVNYWLGLNC